MKIINLAKNNPYCRLRIFSTRPAWGPDGKRYELINYLHPNADKNVLRADSWMTRVATLVVLLLPGLLVLPFFSSTYLNTLSQALHGEFFIECSVDAQPFLNPVYSKVSFKDHLWKRYLSSPAASALYRKTLRIRKRFFYDEGYSTIRNSIQFYLLPWGDLMSQDLKTPWHAHCLPASGVIEISFSQTENSMLTGLLFEMGNLSQLDKIVKRANDQRSGKIKTPEAYAKAIERMEHSTCKIHNRVICQSVPFWGVTPKAYLLKRGNIPFKEWWSTHKHFPHTEHYRIAFRRNNPHLATAS